MDRSTDEPTNIKWKNMKASAMCDKTHFTLKMNEHDETME